MQVFSLLSILSIAVAASSDSLVVGFNYGVKGVRVSIGANIFISLLGFCGTYIAMHMGGLINRYLGDGVVNTISGVVLILLGLYMLYGSIRSRTAVKLNDPDHVDKDCSKVIELRESLTVGLFLCLNNMCLGLAAGFAGMPSLLTSAACSVMNFFFIAAGSLAGRNFGHLRLSKLLEIGSSLLIILLGFKQIA